MSKVELVILGCGSSGGTPAIACDCATCQSNNPKNNRSRCSAYITVSDTLRLLIDTGPDLRYQVLREKITRVDAVLYTHLHADHMNGLDDLRTFSYFNHGGIPLYGNETTIKHIRRCFGYALGKPTPQWDKPVLIPHTVTDNAAFEINGITITPIPIKHGSWDILGWRIGDLAWLTDMSDIPDSSMALLDGLKVVFLDCLREEPYPSHSSFKEACAWAQRIGAHRTVLIHMAHSLEYDTLKACCPPGIEPGYDGMKISSENLKINSQKNSSN